MGATPKRSKPSGNGPVSTRHTGMRCNLSGSNCRRWVRTCRIGCKRGSWRTRARRKKRWRWERAKQYRVGMVVQVLVNRNTILLRYGSDEREREQLQWDSQAEHAAPEKEHSGEKVLDRLNRTRARRRGNPVERKILTGRDSVELTSQPSPGQVGIEAIVPETEVNMGGFPDLPATSNDTKRGDGRAYSICDAVAEVLAEARHAGERLQDRAESVGGLSKLPLAGSRIDVLICHMRRGAQRGTLRLSRALRRSRCRTRFSVAPRSKP